MKNNWSVTYHNWTPEDIKAGGSDDIGFVYESCSLREAIDEVGGQGAYYEANCYPLKGVRWLTNHKYHENFRTGDIEERSLHIPKQITESSRKRLLKYLGVRGV